MQNHSYSRHDLLRMASLAIVYTLLASLVLNLSTANGNVTIFWIPGGLALATLLTWGCRYWPAVYIGAFTAGIMVNDPPSVSFFLATGNTLETLTAVWLLRRLKMDITLNQLSDFYLLAIAAISCTLISALIGPLTLLVAGYLNWQSISNNIFHWWQGDTLGILLSTPLFLIWRKFPYQWFTRKNLAETFALVGLCILTGQIVFLGWFNPIAVDISKGYWLFLFVVWAAVRRGKHGATLIVCITAIQALLGAVQGIGYFAQDIANTGLQSFWFYLLILTLVGIALATFVESKNQAEKQIQEKEERLALATLSNGVGIWDWNLQTLEMVWDDSMFSLYRMQRADFSSAVDAWEKLLHPDDRERSEQEIQDAISGKKPFDTEFRVIWSNGETHHIKAVAKVFRNENGKALRMLGTNVDITERTIVDKMNSEFVSTAAHELRTPMTIIQGYTELLKMDAGINEEQRKMLNTIETQSKAMTHLLNDMLDIARIESQLAGLYEMELQPIGPRLQTLAETFITPDNHNKITLEMSLNLPEVKVDVAKIERAVKNCLSNAYKFSPKRGEVTMRVTEVMHDKQRKVLIAIEDQGIGMTSEQLKRVFEKFYRANPSGAIPGTGLGMAIIKSIIEQHGGSIMIDSEYGKGTKVMLYLPVA